MRNRNLLVLAGLCVLAFSCILLPFWAPALLALSFVKGGVLMCVPTLASRFKSTPCQVVIGNNYDTCGTITRASVSHLTPSQLDDLFRPSGLYADMDAWFRTAFEMKACGTKTNGVYDWIASSMRNVKHLLSVQRLDRGPSLLMPFVLARQDSVVNTDFWAITTGYANSSYTALVTGPLTSADKALGAAGDRVVRVVSRYGVDMDASWFVTRDRVVIFGRSGNGQSTHGQWKVLAAEAAADASYVDVLVTSQNSGSSTPYDTAPTSGVLIHNGNYVNDFESWCHNRPTIDPRKRVPFWIETNRRTRCVDSEYKKVFARLMESNEAFRQFGDLTMAERNRQDEVQFQNQQVNSFFWGKAVSSNQTLALWQNLRQILTATGSQIDPGTGGKLVAYEAYQIGVIEQLRQCDRVRDLQNNALNLYEFFDEIYNIVRARKSQGKMADSIDVYTDSRMCALFETAFVNYMKLEYGDIVRLNIETGRNELGFHWTKFEPKFPQGVTINLISHEYFDDWFNAFSSESIGSSGRMMLVLDIGAPGPNGGTIYPGMIESNRKNRTLGELENLARLDPTFACTMENVTQEITLTSVTKTAVVECPADSLVILGIADAVPTTSGRSVNPSYTNLY